MVVLVVCLYFFPWDMLRGPINRYVSGQLGRRFEITRQLSVHPGRTTTVRAEEVEIANPEWAEDPFFLKARVAEFDIKLFPLLFGKLVIPRISLVEPKIGLQIEPDGRRTWALSRDTSNKGAVPEIGALLVDQGVVTYRARAQGADLHADFSLVRQSGAPLLRFADIERDVDLLEAARDASTWLLKNDMASAEKHLARWLGSRQHYLKA